MVNGVINMRFVSFYFRYKYRVMIAVFLLSVTFVALMWENYSSSILLNLLIPLESVIFTIAIPSVIEAQNNNYEKYRMIFFACTDLSYLKKYVNKTDQKSENLLLGSMHSHMVSHLEKMKILFPHSWEKYFMHNFEKKMMIHENKLNVLVDRHMPEEMKKMFNDRLNVDFDYKLTLDVFTFSLNIYESILKFLSDNHIKSGPNETSLTDKFLYFKNDSEYTSKIESLKDFAENKEIIKCLRSYFRLIKRYANISITSLYWFHNLYDPQLYNSSIMNGLIDDISEKISLAVKDIQEYLDHQKNDIESLIDTAKSVILDELPDDNH